MTSLRSEEDSFCSIFATFFRRKWRKELAVNKFYCIRVGLCGKNGIMSSFSKEACDVFMSQAFLRHKNSTLSVAKHIGHSSSLPRTLFILLYMFAFKIKIKSFLGTDEVSEKASLEKLLAMKFYQHKPNLN
jgi:hypothetical protein